MVPPETHDRVVRRLEERLEQTTKYHRWAFALIFLGYTVGFLFIVIFWSTTGNLQTQLAPYLKEMEVGRVEKQVLFEAEHLRGRGPSKLTVGLMEQQHQVFLFDQEQRQQRTEWRFPTTCGAADTDTVVGLSAQRACDAPNVYIGINTSNPKTTLDVNGIITARKGCVFHGLVDLMNCEHMATDLCNELFIIKQRISRLETAGNVGRRARLLEPTTVQG